MRDSTHVTPKVKLCMHTMFLVCCSKGLVGSTLIFFLGPDIKTLMGAVIYICT